MLSDLAAKTSLIRNAFNKKDSSRLGKLTYELIKEAVFSSDKIAAKLSLISYALKKLLSKRHITESEKWIQVKEEILKNLDYAVEAIRFGNIKNFDNSLKKIMNQTLLLDEKIGNYVINLMEKAKLKQASTAYALGLSLSQAADLTDADKLELQSYIGVTKIHDEQAGEMKLIERINKLKNYLGESN
jgi:predicted XRE-type DNA-binding protein